MTRAIQGFILGVIVAACPALAKVIARSCQSANCQYLMIEGSRILVGYSATPETGILQGLYLRNLQKLVAANEAPFWERSTSGGWRVVLTWGFEEGRYRTAGPTFFVYILKGGILRRKIVGDVRLHRIEVGPLMEPQSEFVIFCGRGETAISATTEVWLLPEGIAPELMLRVGGYFPKVLTTGRGAPALIFQHTVAGESHSDDRWASETWRWDKQVKRFFLQD